MRGHLIAASLGMAFGSLTVVIVATCIVTPRERCKALAGDSYEVVGGDCFRHDGENLVRVKGLDE